MSIPLIVQNITADNLTLEVEPSYFPLLKESNRLFKLLFLRDGNDIYSVDKTLIIQGNMISSTYTHAVN